MRAEGWCEGAINKGLYSIYKGFDTKPYSIASQFCFSIINKYHSKCERHFSKLTLRATQGHARLDALALINIHAIIIL